MAASDWKIQNSSSQETTLHSTNSEFLIHFYGPHKHETAYVKVVLQTQKVIVEEAGILAGVEPK